MSKLSIFAAVFVLAIGDGMAAADGAGLVDPTRPHGGRAVERELTSVGPVLQSTIVTPSERRAMISGRYYRVGDRVGAAEVTDIQTNRVVLRQAGRETALLLFPRFTPQMKHELVSAN